jgi:ubiquitin C-terminal hydrolase
LQDLFKSMQGAKGTRGIMNHRRFISRVRAGKAEFNNDDHHDSHEYITWLIDEIHMNI